MKKHNSLNVVLMSAATAAEAPTATVAQAATPEVKKLTAKQAQAIYTVAVGLTNAESKPTGAAGQAHAANTKAENMAKCLVMNNVLKGASTDKQEKALAVVQAAITEHGNKLNATQAKALIGQVAEASGLKNRTTGKFNKSLAKNYTVMAIQRIAAGL